MRRPLTILPFFALALVVLLALSGASQFAMGPLLAQPYLVQDIAQESRLHWEEFDMLPEMHSAGGLVYFYQDDGIHGRELWRSDGTPLGTFLVRDLCPGSCGTRYSMLGLAAPLGEHLIFVANDGVHGAELWITDGTALGTTMVVDLIPGLRSSLPNLLTAAADQVFFVARTGGLGTGLWRTDGTAKGSYRIAPADADEKFVPTSIHPAPNFVYLCDVDNAAPLGLWRSDGTPAGTVPVSLGSCDGSARSKEAARAVRSDGVLLFASTSGETGSELWRSDGTAAGTFMVADLWAGPSGSTPANFVLLGDELIFTARVAGVTKLWRSDGSAAGTSEIALAGGAQPQEYGGSYAVAGGSYFFAASDADHGTEPWIFDGVSARRVRDVLPGSGSSLRFSIPAYSASFFAATPGGILFSADDGTFGTEVWTSDGTSAGTQRISDIAPGAAGLTLPFFWSYFAQPALADRPLLIEFQTDKGYRLWRLGSDGASMALIETLEGQFSQFPTAATDFASTAESGRGRICFEPVESSLVFQRPLFDPSGFDLWVSDGSASGTRLLLAGGPEETQLTCAIAGDRILIPWEELAYRSLVAVGLWDPTIETLLDPFHEVESEPTFVASRGSAILVKSGGLIRSDGTAAGTAQFAGGLSGYNFHPEPLGDEVLVAGDKIWITDSSEPSGLRVVSVGSGVAFSPQARVAALGDRVLFPAGSSAFGVELCTATGVAGESELLADARPGPLGSMGDPGFDLFEDRYEAGLIALTKTGLFLADDGAHGAELWVTDGTPVGTGLLRDIYPGDYPSTPRSFTRLGSWILFSAEGELEGRELWVSDGTNPGTVLLKDLAPGAASSSPDDLVVQDGLLYFSAWTPGFGREAWKSDGTAAGTVRISDVAPGPLSSSPQRFARAGNRLYFTATDQLHGYELWAISDDGTVPLFLDGFENETTSRWSATTP